MKHYIVELLILLFASSWAQGGSFPNSIYHPDTIVETTYFENGLKKTIVYYTVRYTEDKATAFAIGATSEKDTVFKYKYVLYEDYFEYDVLWNFLRIKRTTNGYPPIFIYGKDQSIGLYFTKFSSARRTNDTNSLEIPIINLINSDLSIHVENGFANHPNFTSAMHSAFP